MCLPCMYVCILYRLGISHKTYKKKTLLNWTEIQDVKIFLRKKKIKNKTKNIFNLKKKNKLKLC